MKIYSLFVLLLLFLTLAEKATDETIKRSFFFGRSADIILRPKNFISYDDSLLITLNDKAAMGESISDVDIAYSLWAPSHGVEALEQQNTESNIIDNHDLFSKTKLNLVFSIDNIGNNVLSKFSNLGLFSGEQRKLIQTAYAQDSLSMLTSIISGREPRSHGIVGSKWLSKNGHLISAFKSSNTMSLVNNYPDLLSKLFVGRSIVFGSSFDFQISSALSAHPALYADHPFWNDYGFYYDQSLESFESLYPFAVFEPDLMLSKSNILSKWEKKIGGIKISCEGSSFSIEIPQEEIFATFNSENSEEFSLLAEIKFVLTSLDMFRTKENWIKLIKDDSPDYISFGFSSLDKIRQIHGEMSSKFKAAVRAVDSLIIYSTKEFNEMYGQSVHSHALFVSPQKVSFSNGVTNLVTNTLSSHLLNPSIVELPSVYLERSAPLKDICKSLSSVLEKDSIDVFCPTVEAEQIPSTQQREEHEFKPYELLVDNRASNLLGNSTITFNDVLVFQLMFWFTIAMTVTLVFASCAVFAIDIPSNSNLIRQLPNLFQDPNAHQQRNLW